MLRRAGVVGSPVAHSLSPVLHRAAYAELGLRGWSYDRAEIGSGGLARHVAGLGPDWVGLSVTMPGKEEALALADVAGEEAVAVGAANTLVRGEAGWSAHNTDVHGLTAALHEAGVGRAGRAVVVGGGATARSVVVALHALGVDRLTCCVRDDLRPATRELTERIGMATTVRLLAEGIPLGGVDVVVSTLPGGAPAPPVVGTTGWLPVVMDVSYDPWPSALRTAVLSATGGRVQVVRGTRMLLHQAVRQVELMTGRPGPTAAMDRALSRHLAAEATS
ncbi:shikimate dehydrogenase [Serinicoccus marinus]|uniref:shikimate dehydrogenase n=1 Tax=Serinicoccus marinus TaxID=247333 RepID=UPI0024925823|nr:shikimate dehydrogenase [Serinicoccus marinus]